MAQLDKRGVENCDREENSIDCCILFFQIFVFKNVNGCAKKQHLFVMANKINIGEPIRFNEIVQKKSEMLRANLFLNTRRG